MRKRLLFGSLSAVAFTVAVVAVIPRSQGTVAQASKVEAVGLPEHGVEVFGSMQSEFATLLAQADEGKATPFSVFVVNRSGQPITAYVFKLEVFLPGGQVVTHIKSKGSSLKTDSDGKSAHLTSIVAANETTLFSLVGSSSPSAEPERRSGISTSGSSEIDRQLWSSEKVKVSVDGVLFADGTFVGPDTENHFEYLRGKIEGPRELNAEVARLVDAGAAPESVRNHLETVSKPQPNSAQNPSGEHSRYTFGKWLAKSSYARLLLLREKTKGYKNVVEHVRAELNKPQIELRRL